MKVNYEVPNAKKLFLGQTSNLTCWAACAAGVKSAAAKKLVIETQFLPEPYLTMFNNDQSLIPTQIVDLYSARLRFKTRVFDTSSRDAVATFVQTNAPVIVLTSIVTMANGVTSHQGYHVRLVYGVVGETTSANEDDFQVRIFDPFPQPGFQSYQGFLFSHFKYQLGLKTGPHSSMVGQCWYA